MTDPSAWVVLTRDVRESCFSVPATRVGAGIDISKQRSKPVEAVGDITFDVVITVCDEANESCPAFPGSVRQIHAAFDDPPRLATGAASEEVALEPNRRVRDEIRDYVAGLPRAVEVSSAGR